MKVDCQGHESRLGGRFAEVVGDRHSYARKWKQRTGGKVLGYLCSYFPEEIAYAAGVLPVRVLGGHTPQDITDSHIFSMYCGYCRDVLAQGLLGHYSYLDGLALAHCCPHIRQTFESWQIHMPVEFNTLTWMPCHRQSNHALSFFLDQLRGTKDQIEIWNGKLLSPEELSSAVDTYNENRRLLMKLYELRKLDPPPFSGEFTMQVVLSSMLMWKAEHNELLGKLPTHGASTDLQGVRLMLVGSENDDIELVRFVESLGAVVAIEDNCIGNRYFWNMQEQDDDLLAGIAKRYLKKVPCPLRDTDDRERPSYILHLAKSYGVQGVIILRQKFCDSHAYEAPILQRVFQQNKLPSLIIESDITIPYGQYRTRIEAFIEMLTLGETE